MWDTVSFAANKLSALSGQSVFLSVTMAVAYEAFIFSSRLSVLSQSEKVHYVSWSIKWSWFCLSLPRRMAVLMKLLNEAEGAIFVQISMTTPAAGIDRRGGIWEQITQISPLPESE